MRRRARRARSAASTIEFRPRDDLGPRLPPVPRQRDDREPAALEPGRPAPLHGRSWRLARRRRRGASATRSAPASAARGATTGPHAAERQAPGTCAAPACTRRTRPAARRCGPARSARNFDAAARPGRQHDALALPAAPARARARGPLRDRGLVRGAGLPDARRAVPARRACAAQALRHGARHGQPRPQPPSVVVWSLGNENTSKPGRRLHALRARGDAGSRAGSTRRGSWASRSPAIPTIGKQELYTSLDALGVNDYFGWYPGPQSSIADRAALAPYLDRLHDDYPRQALFVTEFGAEANRAGPADREGHVRLPGGLPRLPPGRLRAKAVPERRAGLDSA